MIYVAEITDIRKTSSGNIVYYAADSYGNLFFPCHHASFGGGFDTNFTNAGYREGSHVVLIRTQDPSNLYYILGGIPDVDDLNAIKVDGVPSAVNFKTGILAERSIFGANADYNEVHVEDLHLANEGSSLNLSEVSGCTVNTKKMSVQLGAETDALFRVSHSSQAGNQVLNAIPFTNTLFSYLDTIVKKVNAMEEIVSAIAPSAIAALVASGTPQDLINAGIAELALEEMEALGQLAEASAIKTDALSDINKYIKIP
jgi:hypothetical protein